MTPFGISAYQAQIDISAVCLVDVVQPRLDPAGRRVLAKGVCLLLLSRHCFGLWRAWCFNVLSLAQVKQRRLKTDHKE